MGYTPDGDFYINEAKIDVLQDPTTNMLLTTAMLCNDSSLHEKVIDDTVRWEVFGDPTEGALLVAAEKAGLEKDTIELELPRVDEIPFDSAHRFMATLHQSAENDIHLFFKGAPETTMKYCSEIEINGEKKPLTKELKDSILNQGQKMAGDALRVLGIAYKVFPKSNHDEIKSNLLKSHALIFLGLIGMIDPPRPEVKSAINLCKKAGIRVVMATGDHQLTASAIATELGIAIKGEQTLTGQDIDDFDEKDFSSKVLSTHVFARVSPEHKHKIVTALQMKKYLVAVTGDGINDAPALKAAEVGIAMGISGTDVTKETADVVLLDDNFQSIVNAIEEGRVIFENIRKVVKYLLSTNIGEILTIIAVFFLLPLISPIRSPDDYLIFTAIQILWINLVTDGVLDITLALEPKESNVMDSAPRNPNVDIIDRNILINTVFVSTLMAAGTLSLFAFGIMSGSINKAKTMAFVGLAMFQVFNALNCKSRTQSLFKLGITNNKYLIYAIVFSIFMNILATTVPFLQGLLSTIILSIWEWLLIVLISSSVFFGDELRKKYQAKMKLFS